MRGVIGGAGGLEEGSKWERYIECKIIFFLTGGPSRTQKFISIQQNYFFKKRLGKKDNKHGCRIILAVQLWLCDYQSNK